MEELTWKIVAKAPFGWLAPKYYRWDNQTYWQSNQFNEMTDVDMSDLTCIKQAPWLSSFTVVNSYDSNKYETLVFVLDKKIWTLWYAISNSYVWSINLSTHTLTAIHQLPANSVGKSLTYYDDKLYYLYNTATASDIWEYNLTNSWVDNWWSTQSATPANIFYQNEWAVCSDSFTKMVLWNKQDIWLYDWTSLSMQSVAGNSNDNISSIVSTETLTYVASNTPFGWLISIFTNTFSPTDDAWNIQPINADATILLKWDVIWGLFYKNFVYVAYKKAGYDAWTIWYINGSSVTDLFDIEWTLPTFKQIAYFNDNVLFISDGKIYQYGRWDNTVNYATSAYSAISWATCLATIDGNLVIANNVWLYYQNGLSINGHIISLSFICSDRKHLGYVDNISIRTNDLETGAWCTFNLIKNRDTANPISFPINIEWQSRHVTNVWLAWCEELKYDINWSNGSTVNNCEISEIIINWHLEERWGNTISQ